MNRMNRKHLAALVCFLLAGALGLAGQAKPSNLYKEVMDRKGKILFKAAPANAIPADVCTILAACVGGDNKFIAMPKATEAGKTIARGLFLSKDAKKGDVVIILRQTPTDAYFFSVAPDGTIQKAAYYATGKPWIAMGSALSKPIFDKEAPVWIAQVSKIAAGNSAPAPAPAAAPEG